MIHVNGLSSGLKVTTSGAGSFSLLVVSWHSSYSVNLLFNHIEWVLYSEKCGCSSLSLESFNCLIILANPTVMALD